MANQGPHPPQLDGLSNVLQRQAQEIEQLKSEREGLKREISSSRAEFQRLEQRAWAHVLGCNPHDVLQSVLQAQTATGNLSSCLDVCAKQLRSTVEHSYRSANELKQIRDMTQIVPPLNGITIPTTHGPGHDPTTRFLGQTAMRSSLYGQCQIDNQMQAQKSSSAGQPEKFQPDAIQGATPASTKTTGLPSRKCPSGGMKTPEPEVPMVSVALKPLVKNVEAMNSSSPSSKNSPPVGSQRSPQRSNGSSPGRAILNQRVAPFTPQASAASKHVFELSPELLRAIEPTENVSTPGPVQTPASKAIEELLRLNGPLLGPDDQVSASKVSPHTKQNGMKEVVEMLSESGSNDPIKQAPFQSSAILDGSRTMGRDPMVSEARAAKNVDQTPATSDEPNKMLSCNESHNESSDSQALNRGIGVVGGMNAVNTAAGRTNPIQDRSYMGPGPLPHDKHLYWESKASYLSTPRTYLPKDLQFARQLSDTSTFMAAAMIATPSKANSVANVSTNKSASSSSPGLEAKPEVITVDKSVEPQYGHVDDDLEEGEIREDNVAPTVTQDNPSLNARTTGRSTATAFARFIGAGLDDETRRMVLRGAQDRAARPTIKVLADITNTPPLGPAMDRFKASVGLAKARDEASEWSRGKILEEWRQRLRPATRVGRDGKDEIYYRA